MRNRPAVELILPVPGLLGPRGAGSDDPAAARALVEGLDLDGLDRLLARCEHTAVATTDDSSEALLFRSFGYATPPAEGDWPVAAFTALLDCDGDGSGFRLRADPVHLHADIADLVLFSAADAALSRAEASALEVERPGPSYTWETLAALECENPGEERWVVLGADALADLPDWHRPREIVARARIAVVERPGLDEGGTGAVQGAVPGIEARLDRVPMPPLGVSASDLRRRVRGGLPTSPLLPQRVRRLVDELGLYR